MVAMNLQVMGVTVEVTKAVEVVVVVVVEAVAEEVVVTD